MDENTATATPESLDWEGTAHLWRNRAWDEGFLRGLIDSSRLNEGDTLADWEYPISNPYPATAWDQMLAEDARLLEELRRNTPVEE